MRILAPQPSPMNLGLLREEAFAAWGDLKDLNLVETDTAKMVAVYFEDGQAPTQAAVEAMVAAHDGTKTSASEDRRAAADAALARLEALPAASLSAAHGPIIHDILRVMGIRED